MSDLPAFTRVPVLVIGDLMLDRYVYGTVDRISPEAPIPVLHTQRETSVLGGAGNVVRNIAALGGQAQTIGVVGADRAAEELRQLLGAESGVTPRLVTDASRPTTQKTRYIALTQQLLRADYENATPVSSPIAAQILSQISDALTEAKMVVLSDYAKGVLTPEIIAETIARARAAGAQIVIDPKGRDFSRYRGAHMLTPNRKELAEAFGAPISTSAEAEKAARALMQTHGIESFLVKLGADGVCLVLPDASALPFHTQAREVFDVSGAGDTVIATLALALGSGYTPEAAAELANIAGSIVVGKVGTASVSRTELERAVHQGETQRLEDKIVPLDSLAATAEKWRRQGLKVGFTNGCFDLLHPGHIALLRQARAACDRLVVGLNSDASVKRLKGETRPVQNESARSTVLASLADVDHVVIFGEDTPLELIQTLRPDVLIKGADYTLEKVVGAAEVQSWGGRVILANLIQGESTTRMIGKMGAVG